MKNYLNTLGQKGKKLHHYASRVFKMAHPIGSKIFQKFKKTEANDADKTIKKQEIPKKIKNVAEKQKAIKRIKLLEIKTRRLVNGLMQGAYHSVFKGRGIEFSDMREYEAGDDIRTINWNVSAKMNKPFVKEFIEERDLAAIVLLDISGSGNFGTENALKKEIGAEIASSIIFSATRNNDRAGLLLATDFIEKYVPPKKGKKHAMRLLSDILFFEPKSKATNLKKPLHFLSKVLKQKSIIFIVSDFFDSPANFRKELSILGKKHDVIAINLADEREYLIPNVGFIELEDGETGEQVLVDTSNELFRKNFSEISKKRKNEIKKIMTESKVDFIETSTSKEWFFSVASFFKMRQKRRWIR
ncbi:MAG: DUF58 domain-containing protein [Nanoarchaeota archaeon]